MLSTISIITVNLNNAAGLQKTIESVITQTYSAIEYIIIDGGSTDGSKGVIEKYASKLAYQVSEKDNGIYTAMNKGIAKATGEYLLFLNSGDYLAGPYILETILKQKLEHDLVYGNVTWVTGNIETERIFPEHISFDFFKMDSLPHQASFTKRSLFDVVGLYDERYKIISDWKFFLLAMYKYNCSYKHIDTVIAVCSRDGASCDPANWQQIVDGKKEVIQQYFSAFEKDYSALIVNKDELIKVKRMLGYKLHARLRKLLGK